MFYLHSSNKTENLLEHLIAVLQASPLSSPMSKEWFLIQSQGMERWLSQQLALRLQVWANYEFLFPGKFFSSLAERLAANLNDSALDRHLMLWRFDALLRHLHDPIYQPLLQYMQGENIELKRFQLAQQLAKVFDQYQIMRPDMLDAWLRGELTFSNHPTERWQSALWQQIMPPLGKQHRGNLWLDTIHKLHEFIPGYFATQLPERLTVFGVNTMPPLFLEYLYALSLHCDVHLYLLNPTQEFWADLDSKRQRLKAGITEVFVGHPLLSTLGQQGREFQDMLLNQVQFDLELDSFEPAEANSVLQHLQWDILHNALPSHDLPLDDSISIHACHSRMREVEVLKNLLLQTLETDTTLQLRDIVVMAPDIQSYEPFIAAVFNDVQHAIADRSLRLSNMALDTFIRFLHLSQSRFGWHSVLDLLEQTVVYPSFGLDASDLELVKYWLTATQVRWGKSAAHKAQLGLPELAQNTWQATLERLLMGYAVATDDEFVADILPFKEIEGASAQALGGLHDYLQLLFNASDWLATPKTAAQWQQTLLHYADILLLAATSLERQQLYELLAELNDSVAQVHQDPVSISVIIYWLETRVAEEKSSNGFLRGQLTFCSMLPMRSIPFKVIALLGMNHGEFPKLDRLPSFDLLAHQFRKGDRSSRADDRYQFLEILLSVRQQLIITYIGQSIAHNETLPPSVVVSELIDVIHQYYQWSEIVIKHPLQAFSKHYFNAQDKLFSFSAVDCATAVVLQQPRQNPLPWWQGSITLEAEKVIELADLLNFYQHPQKYFLQRQLDLRLRRLEVEAEEREPFELAALDQYIIQHEWIAARLQQTELEVDKLQAEGSWLSGVMGDLEFMRQKPEIDHFVTQIQALNLGPRLDDVPIDITLGEYRVLGSISQRYQAGCLFYRYTNLKGKDFLHAWLQHLLINQVTPCNTYLLSKDVEIHFSAEQVSSTQLLSWLDIYQQGLTRPDAFFVEAAFVYIKQTVKLQQSSRASKSALTAAQEYLQNSVTQPYEPELRQLYAQQQDWQALLGEEFAEQCNTLLLPIWLQCQKEPNKTENQTT